MKFRILAVLLGAAGLCGLARAADPPKNPPSALKSPIPAAASAKIVRGATLTVPNVAAVPGEKKTFSAVLKEDSPGDPPLAGKVVSIRIQGTSLDPKPGESNAQGKATVEITVPSLAPGSYDIVAAWKGDAEHKPATGVGKLTVKAPTR